MLGKRVQGCLLACAVWASSAVQAAQRFEVINGGTCVALPPNPTIGGFYPDSHWLLVWFGETAFCHLTMSDDLPVSNLQYVLFNAQVWDGVLSARLCIHSGDATVTCGNQRTIPEGGFGANYVLPPSPMPPNASGAFVQFHVPARVSSTVFQVIPEWETILILRAAADKPSPTLTNTQLAEQHLASIEKTRAQEADFLNGLAAAIKEEKRDDAWAVQKESELRSSYAHKPGHPRASLKSVECRSSKCDLQLKVNGDQPPKAAVEQQIAISQWISTSQPCGYTMTTAPDSGRVPGAVRIFLDCSK